MFDTRADVLVQFRLPTDWLLPEHVRNLGIESERGREERLRRNSESGAMELLLDRNGASLAQTRERLAGANLKLVDVYAQQRFAPATEHRHHEKPYRLLTFVFRSAGEEKQDAFALFDFMACTRWEYVTVGVHRDNDHAVFCVLAKTRAQAAKMLKPVQDAEAAAFGILVSKSVPKGSRPNESPDSQPTVEKLKSLATPAMRKLVEKEKSSGDVQLDRLLAAGWQIEREDASNVLLFKEKNGARKTMTHHRPKASLKASQKR